jgi:ATP-binding cassette subfamily G (WHITE) protein 2 (SNQ2)
MYRLSPYTYLIEGLLGQALGKQLINCAPVEFVTLNPPSGLSCQDYMAPFMSYAGGYLSNPEATSDCQFCSSRTTDQLLELNFNIFYGHRWRNVGFMVAFIVFNVSLASSSSRLDDG